MNESFKKKIAALFGKADEKIISSKISSFLNDIEKIDTNELAQQIKSIDKNELTEKLSELDTQKLKDLNLNIEEIKTKIRDVDLNKIAEALGDNGEEIVEKLKNILYSTDRGADINE